MKIKMIVMATAALAVGLLVAGEGAPKAPLLRIGAMSDNHLDAKHPETYRRTKACFELFRRLGADIVVDTGDIANRSDVNDLAYCRKCFDEAFAGTDCVPFFCIANHDYNYVPNTKRNDPANIENAWRALKMPGPNPTAVVKGYRFVNVFQNEPKPNALREAVAKAVAENEANRPVFVVNHIPPSQTTTATDFWSSPDVRAALDPFPQIVALTGHNHESVIWPANIWQGTFTSINLGAHADYSNKIEGEVAFLEVYADRIDVRRYEAVSGRELGADDPWSIPLPLDPKNGPYRPEVRAKTCAMPALPPTATCDCRVSKDGVTGTFHVTAAAPRGSAHQYSLEFEEQGADGTWRVLSVCWKRALQVADPAETIDYSVPMAMFDAGRPHRVTVTPFNSHDVKGLGRTFAFEVPRRSWATLPAEEMALAGADGWLVHGKKDVFVTLPKAIGASVRAGNRVTLVIDMAMEQAERGNVVSLWKVGSRGNVDKYYGERCATKPGTVASHRFAWTLGEKPFRDGDELRLAIFWGGKSRFKINGVKAYVHEAEKGKRRK